MVRKKSKSFENVKPFAPAGKLLMIQRNRLANSLLIKTENAVGELPTAGDVHTQKTVVGEKSSAAKTPKSRDHKIRFKPGTRALREIKKFQSTTKLLVPKASFSRVVREIMQTFGKDYKFSTMAMMALQEATEMAIVNLLEVANLCCIHAKRVTLSPSDIRLTRRAFGLGHPVND